MFENSKNLFLSVLLISLILIRNGLCSDDLPEVKTPQGTYRGSIIKSRGGREIAAFKGVPFAKPPVGILRFKEPEELDNGNGVFEANEEKVCAQVILNIHKKGDSTKYEGSEDCLYLNIFRPNDVEIKKKLPVYVWIHGGGFVAGSGSEKWGGPRYLLDHNRDLMMVTINYRLGIFGFLTVNDENIPVNVGMKDQTMALKWIKKNIEMFGGDPDSITIGGVSAGGASVSHHLQSKASKGLFHRAISHSGTADCPWAFMTLKKAKDIGSKLVSFLGCPNESNELMECLQKLSPETLVDSLEILSVNHTAFVMSLSPVIEKDSPTAFLTKESIEEGSNVPWINGVTSEEALIFYQIMGAEYPGYLDLSILKEDYKNILPVLAYYGPRKGDDVITEKLVDFYFGDRGFSKETAAKFIQFLSDRQFNQCYHTSALKHKGKLFLYNFGYKPNVSFVTVRPQGIENEVSHGDDIFLFFNVDLGFKIELNEQDEKKSNELLNMWYNFIVQGDPTPESHLWEASDGTMKYLNITSSGNTMTLDTMFDGRIEFLNNLEKDYKLSNY